MATITVQAGARTLLTNSALNNLGSATYVSAGDINVSSVDPLDVVVEVEATPGTVSGNKQLLVYAKVSMDGTNYSTGPESSTVTTDEPNLRLLGSVPLNSNSTLQRTAFSVVSALGFVPPYMRVIIKNDSGSALAASGHAVNYTTYVGNSA